MKNTKIAAVLCYIAAVILYIAAICTIFGGHATGVGWLLACVASAMLCFGGVLTQRYNRETQKDGENK